MSANHNDISKRKSEYHETVNDIVKREGQPSGDLSDYFCVIECLEDVEDRDSRAIREAKDFLEHLPEITHSQARYESDKVGTLFNLYERGRKQGRRAMLSEIISGLLHNKGEFKVSSRDDLKDDDGDKEKANCSKECMFKGFFGRDINVDHVEHERANTLMSALKHRFNFNSPLRYEENNIRENNIANDVEMRHRLQLKAAEDKFKSYLSRFAMRNGRLNFN